MVMKNDMAARLRDARKAAGYKSAAAAINVLGWKASAYRAHENGQNNFSVEFAEKYAKAYGVTSVWLLFGRAEAQRMEASFIKNEKPKCDKHKCPEKIYALAVLLKDDPDNRYFLEKLSECVANYAAFFNSDDHV